MLFYTFILYMSMYMQQSCSPQQISFQG